MYPREFLDDNYDDGTMPENVDELAKAVIGQRIVKAEKGPIDDAQRHWGSNEGLIITLDNGRQVTLANTYDCCAYTELDEFFLDPSSVDHMILGVGTTDEYETWHIYADFGDIMRLKVGWSSGNPFFYGYGFSIRVKDVENE